MEDHQQWQHDLVKNLSLSPLTWSNHILVSLRLSNTAPFVVNSPSPVTDGPEELEERAEEDPRGFAAWSCEGSGHCLKSENSQSPGQDCTHTLFPGRLIPGLSMIYGGVSGAEKGQRMARAPLEENKTKSDQT